MGKYEMGQVCLQLQRRANDDANTLIQTIAIGCSLFEWGC